MLKNSTNFTSNYSAKVILLPQIKFKMKDASISHKGIVESILGDTVTVNITSVSACSSCHAKGACSASDMQTKLIEANRGEKQMNIGDLVTVTGKESMGFKALFLGYVLPFLLVLFTLITCTFLSLKETTAGLLSLLVLIPYYALLYLTKDHIKKSFIFEIQQ
jgi:sigma-E factor negative regulatory protein RseC